jgi:hypothetical protein
MHRQAAVDLTRRGCATAHRMPMARVRRRVPPGILAQVTGTDRETRARSRIM